MLHRGVSLLKYFHILIPANYSPQVTLQMMILHQKSVIHPLSVTTLSLLWGQSVLLSLGEGRVSGHVTSHQIISEAAMQFANCTSGASWGSLSSTPQLGRAGI